MQTTATSSAYRIRSKTGIFIRKHSKCLEIPYGITFPTKILTLAITPFLFILLGVLYEFAMVSGVNILLFPQEVEVHSFS